MKAIPVKLFKNLEIFPIDLLVQLILAQFLKIKLYISLIRT